MNQSHKSFENTMLELKTAYERWLDQGNSVSPIVIAGGCWRDYTNGKDIKDVDVFYYQDESVTPLIDKLQIAGWKEKKNKIGSSQYSTYYEKEGLYLPINFIPWQHKIDKVWDVTLRFDINICKLGVIWNKATTASVITTQAYTSGMLEKKIKVKLSPHVPKITHDHIKRVREKYPWPVSIEYVE